jgi:DNA-binding response OmpR family regulator
MAMKILIADDDADLRRTIRALLSEEFEVLEAANGLEAVEVAGRERPRLILLDISMPHLCGIDALDAIRAADPAALVIMLTSESDIETASETLRLGAAAYVTKPFDMDILRAEIRRMTGSEPVDQSGRPWRTRT